MTYLELVKATARASETSSPNFNSIDESTDYVGLTAEYVREAWVKIQAKREDWDWRQREFTFETVPGKWSYGWDEMRGANQANRSIPNSVGFRRWRGDEVDRGGKAALRWIISIPANDYAAGSQFPYTPFADLRVRRLTRSDISTRPTQFTVSPQRAVQVYPIPDGAYRISGMFVKGIQILTNDNDVPEGLSGEYFDLIKWYAVMNLHGGDEAEESVIHAKAQYDQLMDSFERAYLPSIKVGGALA